MIKFLLDIIGYQPYILTSSTHMPGGHIVNIYERPFSIKMEIVKPKRPKKQRWFWM